MIESTKKAAHGQGQLKMDFKYDGGGAGKGGMTTLFTNGKMSGRGRTEKSVPGRYRLGGFDLGRDLFHASGPDHSGIISMVGHRDGIISLGAVAGEASSVLLRSLAVALTAQRESHDNLKRTGDRQLWPAVKRQLLKKSST